MENLPNNIKVVHEPSVISSDCISIKFYDLNLHNGVMVLPKATYDSHTNTLYWDGYDSSKEYLFKFINYLRGLNITSIGLSEVDYRINNHRFLLNIENNGYRV